ncbi:glutamine synthetase [Clostridiaceae bacterium NSJ-31]|uniref:Glutamine synthetase n=1 Tax=Ligaoa zhengdingensis TaxID=2763658 RepID=A0A926DYH3_9FIRM|nr:glutamine synthetase family protein [Ligaoa zhengdingensis]MBC8545774.1 glutamine synthetase [Ligaoa zhengdingensis]
MNYTVSEVLQFVRENDVKFIRLAFCDIFGVQKNISIMPAELPRAFENGISFDASAVRGFLNVDESDLFLFPDPATLSILPWRPAHSRVVRMLCDIRRPDGTLFEGDTRGLLRRAVADAARMGLQCRVGAECEFYLFERDEAGEPTMIPHDRGGYFDVSPRDKGENVRREICLTLEEMGIQPESSHHEQGPGQNEIDFKYSDALTAADNLITFKWVVRTTAARNGLHASFLPKPFADWSGSGLHVNLSVCKNGINLFDHNRSIHNPEVEAFMQGILDRVPEITAFLNPLTNSYARFGRMEAPGYVTWSHQNRSQLVRVPAAKGEYSRMELRSPDPSCNPYLAFALLIQAGLEGIGQNKKLCAPVDGNLFSMSAEELAAYTRLPQDLEEALGLAQESAFVRRVLPTGTLDRYIAAKRAECDACGAAGDREQFERDRYFAEV